MKKYVVTGGAGFIGSHLTKQLILDGHRVVVIDDLSTGDLIFLSPLFSHPHFKFVNFDLNENIDSIADEIDEVDAIFHLAGNPDTRKGIIDLELDLNKNILTTLNILKLMKKTGVRDIIFASSCTLYGEKAETPISEAPPMPVQSTPYSASKLAAEAYIQAYCFQYDLHSWIFRFATVLGERYQHGHICDFYKQLKKDGTQLKVMGDGKQLKNFIYVGDLVNGLLTAYEKSKSRINIFNLASDEAWPLYKSIKVISKCLNVQPEVIFEKNCVDIKGENFLRLQDCSLLKDLGWSAKYSTEQAIKKTVHYLIKNDS